MKRNEIDSQLTWDLRFLFENQEAFEAQFALAQKEIKSLQAALSSLADDRASFISFMEHQETLERYLDNLISYGIHCQTAAPQVPWQPQFYRHRLVPETESFQSGDAHPESEPYFAKWHH